MVGSPLSSTAWLSQPYQAIPQTGLETKRRNVWESPNNGPGWVASYGGEIPITLGIQAEPRGSQSEGNGRVAAEDGLQGTRPQAASLSAVASREAEASPRRSDRAQSMRRNSLSEMSLPWAPLGAAWSPHT